MSVTISTLSDLKRENWRIYANCTGKYCGHGRSLDIDMLIDRLGPDHVFIQDKQLEAMLRCEKCGQLGATVRIGAPGKAEARTGH